MMIGNGPILIERATGDFWEVSSNPGDMFGHNGELGWTKLTSIALFRRWRDERQVERAGNVSDFIVTPQSNSD